MMLSRCSLVGWGEEGQQSPYVLGSVLVTRYYCFDMDHQPVSILLTMAKHSHAPVLGQGRCHPEHNLQVTKGNHTSHQSSPIPQWWID